MKILDYHIEKRPNILEQSMTDKLAVLPFEEYSISEKKFWVHQRRQKSYMGEIDLGTKLST